MKWELKSVKCSRLSQRRARPPPAETPRWKFFLPSLFSYHSSLFSLKNGKFNVTKNRFDKCFKDTKLYISANTETEKGPHEEMNANFVVSQVAESVSYLSQGNSDNAPPSPPKKIHQSLCSCRMYKLYSYLRVTWLLHLSTLIYAVADRLKVVFFSIQAMKVTWNLRCAGS